PTKYFCDLAVQLCGAFFLSLARSLRHVISCASAVQPAIWVHRLLRSVGRRRQRSGPHLPVGVRARRADVLGEVADGVADADAITDCNGRRAEVSEQMPDTRVAL